MNRRRFCAVGAAAVGLILPRRAEAGSPKIEDRLERAADWIRGSFVGGEINLVPNLPSGRTRGGTDRSDLKTLFWLQNCNLFAARALRRYDKTLAETIQACYRRWYQKAFPEVLEKTDHYLPLGVRPEMDVPEGRFARVVVKVKDFGSYRIGTETHEPGNLGVIPGDDPRTLLKQGVLRAVLDGRRDVARTCFKRALALWDGVGFRERKLHGRGRYHTRCLAYGLVAARALGRDLASAVLRQIETRLWTCQDADGGLWTDYCADGSVPALAKKTNEIAPLVLLAYEESIWK